MRISFYRRYFENATGTLARVIISALVMIEMSCGGDIPDCPSQMCVIAGGWKLTEVYIDGVRDTRTDLSRYRLTLLMPDPATATISDFNRVNPSGVPDGGTWTISTRQDVLTLSPSNTPVETYSIQSLTPRRLVLDFDYAEDKTGRVPYQFVLEPF